ncbi:hypothetical protein [Mucilaginibacter antarcticus]|uniref:Tetrapyrrole biosynthesis uroporphyrinogen III synthase domain-containing protein n=1 Tax=Mucilaginibacter antarcticus TaxID=1855725 RepID=A0ABW5XQZ7_9SPHI
MKLLLVEDRISRMEQFSNIDISKIANIDIITDKPFDNLILELDQKKHEVFDKYDCLMIHRSALTNLQRDIVKNHCELKNKPLVFFSGGITASLYNDKRFSFLNINSKDFYSPNFKLFTDEINASSKINLLTLQFGAKWKLNLLLSLRNEVNTRIQLSTIKRVRDLQINNMIKNELVEYFDLAWLKAGDLTEITESQVHIFYNKLNLLISESV